MHIGSCNMYAIHSFIWTPVLLMFDDHCEMVLEKVKIKVSLRSAQMRVKKRFAGICMLQCAVTFHMVSRVYYARLHPTCIPCYLPHR